MEDILLTIVIFLGCILLVILLVCTGWYIVWKLFLSRFKFVRELLMASNGASDEQRIYRPRGRRARVD